MSNSKQSSKAKHSQPRTFEAAIARLEEIVNKLESGEEPLDTSVRLFEEAMGLCEFCRKQLDAAQGRIQRLVEKADGGVTLEPAQEEE